MEKVEGLLKNMQLSEAERKGLKLGADAEKPVGAVGEQLLSESGKRKALDNGPWKCNSGLLVMEDYDPDKAMEEYTFDTIPIWVRILKLPLGRMNRASGEAIGDELGEFVLVDVGEDDMVVGDFLRVKVKLKITEPLRRGMMIQVREGVADRWCPIEYEFLPEFCYTCGIIGHDDKVCSRKLARGEKQQFGPWLRARMPMRSNLGERRSWDDKGGNNSWGAGGTNRSGGSGSDSRSWRKDDGSGVGSKNVEKGQEATSPLKKLQEPVERGTQKQLSVSVEDNKSKFAEQAQPVVMKEIKLITNKESTSEVEIRREEALLAQPQGDTPMQVEEEANKEVEKAGAGGRIIKRYKKKEKQRSGKLLATGSEPEVKVGSKRGAEPMDTEEEDAVKGGKKLRSSNTENLKGLSEQPCADQ
ncbi:hypothetical protein ACQ4PT_070192 [Festuca glaucescens]